MPKMPWRTRRRANGAAKLSSNLASEGHSRQSHRFADRCEPGPSPSRPYIFESYPANFGRSVRPIAQNLFGTDTLVFENQSLAVGSSDREVNRAHHDAGNFAALRFAKEEYLPTCPGGAYSWNQTTRRNRGRF